MPALRGCAAASVVMRSSAPMVGLLPFIAVEVMWYVVEGSRPRIVISPVEALRVMLEAGISEPPAKRRTFSVMNSFSALLSVPLTLMTVRRAKVLAVNV